MKEFYNNIYDPKETEVNDEEYSMPNEGCCSPEFPEGCILID